MEKTLESEQKYVVELPPPIPKDLKHTCSNENCGKTFVKLSRLHMHEVTHLSEKPFKCPYDGCEASYYRKNHLKRHEATRHSKVGDYMCSFDGCTASFETAKSLYFHGKRRHCEKKFTCSTCGEMFSKKFILKEHEYGHTGNPPFICTSKGCKESFIVHTNFKAHQKMHRQSTTTTDETQGSMPSRKCRDCDSIFVKWSSYVIHRKTAHPTAVCPVCKKTVTKSQLRFHVKVHDDKRHSHSCPHEGCSRFYFHINNLNHHIKHAHEGLGYQCDICHRKLSTKQKLELHIQVVHGNAKSPTKKIKSFSREKLFEKLCGEADFTILRRGPAKGCILEKQTSTVDEAMEVIPLDDNDGLGSSGLIEEQQCGISV